MRENRNIFALGFFDGVHLGHQALLKACVALAREMHAQPAAITFENHPQSLFSNSIPPLINTLEDRRRLMRDYGVEHIIYNADDEYAAEMISGNRCKKIGISIQSGSHHLGDLGFSHTGSALDQQGSAQLQSHCQHGSKGIVIDVALLVHFLFQGRKIHSAHLLFIF